MANIQKLNSGNWRARVYLGRDVNGKQKFKSFTADERWKAEKLAREFEKGGKDKNSFRSLTVGKVIDDYIELKRNVLAPSTIHGYERTRRTRLQSIMDIKADKLDTLTMQRAINEDAKRLGHKSLKDAKCLVISYQPYENIFIKS